jgi:pectin methylesterase-like acyl-CoA thioesterase
LLGLQTFKQRHSPPISLRCRLGPSISIIDTSDRFLLHFASIQAAVDATKAGDWVLIDVGTYNEPVYITMPRIHLRGIDRNGVVLDGQHQAGNGVAIPALLMSSERRSRRTKG